MKQSKIFESRIIDFETGEVKSVTTVTAAKFAESFQMCRTTSGIEWVAELTGNEIKTLIFLLELESSKQQLVTLGPTNRKELAKFLKVSVNAISRIIKTLEDKQYLIRLNNQEIKLNPKGFYKGASKDVIGRINEFNKVFSSRQESKELTPEVNLMNSSSQNILNND